MEKAPKGIENLGNTCYINTCIQILSHIPSIEKIILTSKVHNVTKIETFLWKNWKDVINIMNNDVANEIIHPNGLIHSIEQISKNKNLSFLNNHEPEDITEFLIFLIECIHECLSREIDISISGISENDLDDLAIEVYKTKKKQFEKQYSEINLLFYGIQISQILSLDNSFVHSRNIEGYFVLDLPLPFSMPKITNGSFTIYDCIENYIKPEILEGDNQWFDEKKNEKINVQKSMSFWSFPTILIISLKRNDYTGKKNNMKITYPLVLELTKYVIGYKKTEFVYDLAGICCHFGNSMNGHYAAFVKKEDKWYFCNDDKIQLVEKEEHLQTNYAYCLFYVKKNNTI